MKKYLIWVVFSLFVGATKSQSIYRKDYVETFDADWSGVWWTPAATTNYYTNASVTPTTSSVLYGIGNGTSVYESDWYSFPNLVVDPNYEYSFRFRLGSYRFTSTATTRGVDAGDYVTVQLSTNGGTSYVSELRIAGNNNAFWNYNTSASYTKIANGTLTTISPAAGGDRTSTGDGYSVIRLDIPAGVSNIAIDIFCRANSAGEEWWLDNFELWRTPIIPLPVEMISFTGFQENGLNVLEWSTASEMNSDYFLIEKSTDGEDWKFVQILPAAGNSNQKIDYRHVDKSWNKSEIVYYRLLQYDMDGKMEMYGPISILNSVKTPAIKGYTDLLGRSISEDYKGWCLEVYDNGEARRILK